MSAPTSESASRLSWRECSRQRGGDCGVCLKAARGAAPYLRAMTMRSFSVAAGCVGLLLSACGDSRMSMDGKMTFDGAVSLEGPIQIQMSGPSITYSGSYVSERLFEQIKIGVTRDEWILAVLGEPDARSSLSDGTELWRWTYQPASQQGSLLTVWQTGGKDEPNVKQSITIVEFRNGLVSAKWRD